MARLLTLEPATELKFNGPFTEAVTSYLKLSNANDRPINFKLNGNGPFFFEVSPDKGVIPPHGSVDVIITLRFVNRSKNLATDVVQQTFMVRAAYATDEPVRAFWRTVDASNVSHSELDVIFENLGQNNPVALQTGFRLVWPEPLHLIMGGGSVVISGFGLSGAIVNRYGWVWPVYFPLVFGLLGVCSLLIGCGALIRKGHCHQEVLEVI